MGPTSMPMLCDMARSPIIEPIALVRRPSSTPKAMIAGNDMPPANPKNPLASIISKKEEAILKYKIDIIASIPPDITKILLLNRSAKYPMGIWKIPATSTLIMTTKPMAELESPNLVLAKKGKKVQVMPMQVVKQARNMKREKTEGSLISSR